MLRCQYFVLALTSLCKLLLNSEFLLYIVMEATTPTPVTSIFFLWYEILILQMVLSHCHLHKPFFGICIFPPLTLALGQQS